tara:strand:+ start:686 stop:1105 length:420 start_codon:yes stop_codon:yes gene_type:complete
LPPPSPPPAPPPLLVINVNGTDHHEGIVVHNTYTRIEITGDTVEVGDQILWIRRDWKLARDAESKTGPAMCAEAADTTHANALSTDSTPPDHGGVVSEVDGKLMSEVQLFGQIDPVDPLNTDNQEDTGTVRIFASDTYT